jgi:hypothetical protein
MNGHALTLATAVFSAILLPVCRETRGWGYVCDNTAPKTNSERDVLTEFLKVLDRLDAGYRERDQDRAVRNGGYERLVHSRISQGDAKVLSAALEPASVKLVLTSPPYFGVSDYIKSQRLSMEWFNFELEPLRQQEIGARSKRHRLSAIDEYLHDLAVVFETIEKALHPDGVCVIVIGESKTRRSTIETFVEQLPASGLNVVTKLKRSVSVQRRQFGSIDSETVIVAKTKR